MCESVSTRVRSSGVASGSVPQNPFLVDLIYLGMQSEAGQITLACVLLLLEVLVLTELTEERKKHMQRLNYRLIIRGLVHRDIRKRTD